MSSSLIVEAFTSFSSNCFSIKSFTTTGVNLSTNADVLLADLTNSLDRKFGLNLSLVFPCFDKSIEVFTTLFAFEENQSVKTIIKPAANNNAFGVGTLEANTSILNELAGTPETTHAS